MRCHVIQKNTAPVVLDIDDYQPRLGSAGNLGLQAALPSTHQLILGKQLPVKTPCGRDAPLKSALGPFLDLLFPGLRSDQGTFLVHVGEGGGRSCCLAW